MLYLHAFLSRSRLCHALCLLWACAYRSLGPPACVVASVPLVAYLGVTTYEIHLCGVGLLDAYPFYTSFDVMLALLALCHCLAPFASLHACLHVHAWVCVVHAWVCVSFSMLSFYLFPLSLHVHAWSMDTWSKGATS